MKTSQKMNIDLVKQYAENQNQRQSIIIVFIGSIALAIGSFGYTLNQFVLKPTDEHLFLLTTSTVFSLLILLLITVLSLFLSYSLRRDQFLINKIRRNSYNTSEYRDYYNKFNPKNTVQDFYLILIWGSIIFKTGLLSIYLWTTCLFYDYDCIILIPLFAYFICIVTSAYIWIHYKQRLNSLIVKQMKD